MPPLRQHLAEAAAALATAGVEEPRLTAELLLAHVLGRERSYLYAHPEDDLDIDWRGAPLGYAERPAYVSTAFMDLVRRRAEGTPLQYLSGMQEFYGRPFAVSPAVLIPRPETELVIAAALELVPGDAPARIADIGTGSGCLAVTLALERPRAVVVATDISPAALALARRNADALGARVEFLESDLLAAAPGPFDLVVSNPPYIPDSEWATLQREVRDHEPRLALLAGPTGAEVYARLIPQAHSALRPGGGLVLELGYNSAPAVRALLTRGDWSSVATRRDAQGWERVLTARRMSDS
ncbi:MAG TPA: peptide chain release factor N(5)-glutamine methyltransferase [Terriglobales bacterium]|jgi:release factor glutamine methyltransferase